MATNLVKDHWTRDAECKLDPIILSNKPEDIAAVKAMCKTCPVQAECIKWTEELDSHFVSAGTTRFDRLMLQWKRVTNESESNFRDSSEYVSAVMRRVR